MEKKTAKGWLAIQERTPILNTVIGDVMSQRFRCLRTGCEGDYISLHTRNWVTAVAETADGQIILVRQFRHGTLSMQWEFPGGCMEPHESDPVTAAIRELREETGYTGHGILLGSYHPNPAIMDNRCFCILVENAVLVGTRNMDDMEDIEVCTTPRAKVMEMFRSGEIDHGIMYSSMMLYAMHKQKDWMK